jgi:predicted transcriptional regulator
MSDVTDDILITLTADIVSSHVANNQVPVATLPELISKVHEALKGLGATAEEPKVELQPAVPIRSSVKPD